MRLWGAQGGTDTSIDRIRAERRNQRGQALVELALVAPVLILLVVGVIDVGRAFYYREQVINATRQALRVAVSSSQQATGNTACGRGGTLTATLPAASTDPLYAIGNAALLESSATGSPAGSPIAGSTLTVTWHCSGGNAVTNSTNGGITDPSDSRSDSIDVKLDYLMPLVTPVAPSVLGTGQMHIAAEVPGRVQY